MTSRLSSRGLLLRSLLLKVAALMQHRRLQVELLHLLSQSQLLRLQPHVRKEKLQQQALAAHRLPLLQRCLQATRLRAAVLALWVALVPYRLHQPVLQAPGPAAAAAAPPLLLLLPPAACWQAVQA